jgi:membrane-associated phospholipid phosphatase
LVLSRLRRVLAGVLGVHSRPCSTRAGLGYLSGHAGVAGAPGAAAGRRGGAARRPATLSAVPLVGLTRIYVGAHLPLDLAVGAAATLVSVSDGITRPAARRIRNRREGG